MDGADFTRGILERPVLYQTGLAGACAIHSVNGTKSSGFVWFLVDLAF